MPVARRGSDRDRSRRSSTPDPIRDATKGSVRFNSPNYVGYDASAGRPGKRTPGDVRIAVARQAERPTAVRTVPRPTIVARPSQPPKTTQKPKPRLERKTIVPGKQGLDRGRKGVSIKWQEPKTEKAGHAARRGSQTPKSASKKTAARSSAHRDARQWKDVDKKLKEKRAKSREQLKKDLEALKKEKPICKPRPKDTRPKGGGGSSRDFVPWC